MRAKPKRDNTVVAREKNDNLVVISLLDRFAKRKGRQGLAQKTLSLGQAS